MVKSKTKKIRVLVEKGLNVVLMVTYSSIALARRLALVESCLVNKEYGGV